MRASPSSSPGSVPLFVADGLQPEQAVREKVTPNVELQICSLKCELKFAQGTVSAPKSGRFWNFPLWFSWCLQEVSLLLYFGVWRWHCADPTEFMGNSGSFEWLSSMQSLRKSLGEILRIRTSVTLSQLTPCCPELRNQQGSLAQVTRLGSPCAEVNQDVTESRV